MFYLYFNCNLRYNIIGGANNEFYIIDKYTVKDIESNNILLMNNVLVNFLNLDLKYFKLNSVNHVNNPIAGLISNFIKGYNNNFDMIQEIQSYFKLLVSGLNSINDAVAPIPTFLGSYSIESLDGKIVECFKVSNILDFCLIVISRAYTYNINILECENCGDFFLPKTRNDEKYCDKIHENGRTCKDMGYENKIKSDEIMSEYRRVYKIQNAKKRRRAKKDPNAEAGFKRWVNKATDLREMARSGDISVEEFIRRLNTMQ